MSDATDHGIESAVGDWDGRFWPFPPRRTELAFDRIGTPYVALLRHLPTNDALMRAEMAFGPEAHAMLCAWRDAWRDAVGDVDAFQADASFQPHVPDPDNGKASKAALLMPEAPGLAAALTIADEEAGALPAHRDEAFHILEDAHVVTSLLRAGTPFALVAGPTLRIPTVLAGDGKEAGRLRLVRWDGDPDDQHFHASIAKRARALVGAPNPYWESPAFRRVSGRLMAVAEGPNHLAVMLRDMAASGASKAFLKSTVSKRGTWVADLDAVIDARSAALAAHAAMGFAYGDLYHAAPDPRGSILVQEFLPFSHEHRFLVVGNRVVASTASNRDLSVLDRHTNRIVYPGAAKLRTPAGEAGAYDRGESETVRDRSLAAAMALKARETVRAIAREGMLPDCYCLDIGLSGRGVLPIEVNTVTHCGIYAADWARVARALARRRIEHVAETLRSVPVTMRDPVGDALEFLLDMLADEPPMRLHEVARALSKAGDDAEAARRAGWEARARREAEEARPLTFEDREWLSSVVGQPGQGEDLPCPARVGDQAAERAGVPDAPADSSSAR